MLLLLITSIERLSLNGYLHVFSFWVQKIGGSSIIKIFFLTLTPFILFVQFTDSSFLYCIKKVVSRGETMSVVSCDWQIIQIIVAEELLPPGRPWRKSPTIMTTSRSHNGVIIKISPSIHNGNCTLRILYTALLVIRDTHGLLNSWPAVEL